MAKYTRAEIRRILGDAHTDDIENQLIALYLGVVDPMKDELARAKAEAEKLSSVQKELDELKAKGDDGWKDKHDIVQKQFNDYKADVESRESRAAKEKAAKAYFESKNIESSNINIALRSSAAEIDKLELDGEKIKDTKILDDLISGDLSGLVGKPKVSISMGGKLTGRTETMTREDIVAIKDGAARRKAIAEHPDLFGLGNKT